MDRLRMFQAGPTSDPMHLSRYNEPPWHVSTPGPLLPSLPGQTETVSQSQPTLHPSEAIHGRRKASSMVPLTVHPLSPWLLISLSSPSLMPISLPDLLGGLHSSFTHVLEHPCLRLPTAPHHCSLELLFLLLLDLRCWCLPHSHAFLSHFSPVHCLLSNAIPLPRQQSLQSLQRCPTPTMTFSFPCCFSAEFPVRLCPPFTSSTPVVSLCPSAVCADCGSSPLIAFSWAPPCFSLSFALS